MIEGAGGADVSLTLFYFYRFLCDEKIFVLDVHGILWIISVFCKKTVNQFKIFDKCL